VRDLESLLASHARGTSSSCSPWTRWRRARGSGSDRARARQPRGQRPRCDRRGRPLSVSVAPAQLASRTARSHRRCLPHLRSLTVADNRQRHRREGSRARVRALLHDEGGRSGHRARAVDGLRNRRPERRRRRHPHGARRRDGDLGLSAVAAEPVSVDDATAPSPRCSSGGRRRSCSSRTNVQCASSSSACSRAPAIASCPCRCRARPSCCSRRAARGPAADGRGHARDERLRARCPGL